MTRLDAPAISVIIPVYNGAKTIRATINSVLQQSFQDFEILVVDDGSMDETVSVIRSIGDPRIRCFSKPNGGQATARNLGILRSIGNYLAFLDADDLWHPSKLLHHKEILETIPTAGAVYCKGIGLGAEETLDSAMQRISSDRSPLKPSGRILDQLIRVNFIGSGSNFVIRREVVDQIGFFNPELNGAEDWDFYLRVAEKFEIHCVQNVEIFYRVYPQSFSSSQISTMELSCVRTVEAAFGRAPVELRPLKNHTLTGVYRYLLGKARRSESRRTPAGIWRGLRYFLTWCLYLIRSNIPSFSGSLLRKKAIR